MEYKNIERMVNQTLWYAIMLKPYQGDEAFENDTFVIKPYDWSFTECENEDGKNEWHFYHKLSGLKIYWYKYPLRSAQSNMDITNEQFYAVLQDCMNSINSKIQNDTFKKWWAK